MIRSIFTNSAGILVSRILGFVRDLLTASVLGANLYSDIFFIAFKLPNLFRRIFAEGAFTQSFLPAFTRSRHKAVFSVHVLGLFTAVLAVLTLAVNLFPHAAAKGIALGFDADTVALSAPFVAINFWYLLLIFGVTFLSTFLQYRHHFATTAFATSLLNLALIAALLLSRESAPLEIVAALSYGVVVGGVLQLAVHLIALKAVGMMPLLWGGFRYFSKKARTIRDETRRFSRQFFPAVWGNSTAQISAFLDTWLASFLTAGSISYLYYANRIFQLPLALFAIATSIALFPRVARYLKFDNESEALQMLERAFWLLAFVLMFSALGGYILAKEITWLLFERGAFTASDTAVTSSVLQMYMIGLLPFGLTKLFSLWLYAQQRQMEAAKIASWTLGSNVVFSLALILPLGAPGLALASTVSGFIGFFLTLRAFGRQRVLAIMAPKYTVAWLAAAAAFTALLIVTKELLHGYL
jgi:putative peptidoglycan lipid II flippase